MSQVLQGDALTMHVGIMRHGDESSNIIFLLVISMTFLLLTIKVKYVSLEMNEK